MILELLIGLWNACSLANKLNSMVLSMSLDIFSVTETWLSAHVFDRDSAPKLFHLPAGLWQSTCCSIKSKTFYSSPSSFTYTLCCVYAPPSSPASYFTNIAHCLYSIPTSSHLILLGDFNVPDVNWSTLHTNSSSSSSYYIFIKSDAANKWSYSHHGKYS